MPDVNPGESRSHYIARCIPIVKAESQGQGYKPGFAYEKCRGMFEQAQKKGKKRK